MRIRPFRDETVLFILNKIATVLSKHKSKFNALKLKNYERLYVSNLVDVIEEIQFSIKKFRKLVLERRGW